MIISAKKEDEEAGRTADVGLIFKNAFPSIRRKTPKVNLRIIRKHAVKEKHKTCCLPALITLIAIIIFASVFVYTMDRLVERRDDKVLEPRWYSIRGGYRVYAKV